MITNSVQPTLGRIILNCGFWQLSGIHPVTEKGPFAAEQTLPGALVTGSNGSIPAVLDSDVFEVSILAAH